MNIGIIGEGAIGALDCLRAARIGSLQNVRFQRAADAKST